jgi:DNA repair protein RecO (recombination protein O)
LKRHLKTQALILAGRDLGESDRIITLLSRDFGRFSAVAKGAKRSTKRFAGTLELFSLVEVCAVDSGRELLHLDSCDLLEPYPALRQDVQRYAAACYLCELARELCPEREPVPEAFELLTHALAQLDAGADYPWRLVAELRLLALAGFAPRLEGCLRCNAEPSAQKTLRFFPGLGGVLCDSCAEADRETPSSSAPVEVSAGTLRLLAEAERLEMGKLSRLRFSRLALEEGERLLTSLVRQVLGKELKSRKFLESVA